MRFKNIIFDFDGTLVDSRPGVVRTFQKIVKELTTKEVSEEKIVSLIGIPLIPFLQTLLNTKDKVLVARGSVLFKKYYEKEGLYQNIVYPETKQMLKFLKNNSCQLFVVSNKIESFMKKILEQHGLKKYFISFIATKGTDARSKKADYIKHILTHYKLKKEETVMVGDTESDITAAKKNSIYSIGVTWGYGSEFDLIKAKADIICHTPLELKQLILKNEKRKTIKKRNF